MNEKEYLQLVNLSDKFELRISMVFDKLDKAGILPGNFYINKMIPVKIDNIMKDKIILEYFDDGYDVREERDVIIPTEIIFDEGKLDQYIDNILCERAKSFKEMKEREENEAKKRRYETYMELKQEFEKTEGE